MLILDRYVLVKFIMPFVYCVFGFIAIWLVFDLSDNGPDFLEARVPLWTVIEFYSTQIPEIIVISLPVGALLALLYSLTQMSRSNEIVSMLGAGISIVRIILPLIGFGIILAGISMYFSYEQAPHAAKIKKEMLREINSGKKRETALSAHLFRNRADHRTWYMRRIFPESDKLLDVLVLQQNEQGDILLKWYGKEFVYDKTKKQWTIFHGMVVVLKPDGEVESSKQFERVEVDNWSETPWRIASSALKPEYLSVPELEEYLEHNADFPADRLAPFNTYLNYRWALPWVNLLVIFIAAPLGIVYSRRGILGGVALAIGLFFSLVFVSSLFVALGKGAKIDPFWAAWAPLVIFAAIASVFLYMRSMNRDIKIPWF